MGIPHTQTDKLARSLLAKQGIGAIWRLYEGAAAAHRAGFPHSAAALIEVAEAAELAWIGETARGVADVIGSLREGA